MRMETEARATLSNEGLGSDEALVSRLCDGDAEALMVRHASAVVAFCRCYVDRDSAEDASQETFVRVLERCHTMKPSLAFKPWLFAIARNVCLGVLRQRRDRAMVPIETVAEMADAPDEAVAKRERFRAALREVGRLPQHYREVVVMCFLFDLSCEEIAVALGLKPVTVRVRLHRAIRQVQGSLGRRGML